MHFPISYLQEILRVCENSKTGLRWNERKNNEKWNKKYANKEAGSISVSGSGIPAWRLSISYNDVIKKYYAHRIIKSLILKRCLKKCEIVDHKDNNPLNNKIKNLRLGSYSQNNFNRRVSKKSKTGIKNVHLLESGDFSVQVGIKNKVIYGGIFTNKIDAAKRAKELRKEHHGRFANDGIRKKKFE